MPAKPPKKRRARTAARSKSKPKRKPAKRSKPKTAPKKRKAAAPKKRKAAKRKAAAPKKATKLKKPRKLIAPRKRPPKPAEKPIDIRDVLRERREQQQDEITIDREERPRDDWKTIDPFADFERVDFSTGEVLDEDEDAPIIDPDGDPSELPGFEPFKDLPPGVDVHDYIAWLHEAYDLDIGELYEMYFGDADT